MTTLFILNDANYGTERSYNGLRLAGQIAKREGEQVRVFLTGRGVLRSSPQPSGHLAESGVEMSPAQCVDRWCLGKVPFWLSPVAAAG